VTPEIIQILDWELLIKMYKKNPIIKINDKRTYSTGFCLISFGMIIKKYSPAD
jgi:hypothetical protein